MLSNAAAVPKFNKCHPSISNRFSLGFGIGWLPLHVSKAEHPGGYRLLLQLYAYVYVESHLSNTATKFYGELTQQMLKLSDAPGSDNGTGFFQTLCALKIREIYEKITSKSVAASTVGV